MKKLLVPTDFSQEAQNAVDLAAQLAEKLDAEIILLHVLEIPYGSYSVMGEIHLDYTFDQVYQTQLINSSKQKLDELVKQLKAKAVQAASRLIFGNPYVHISKTISDQNVDLVVIGSKGASGLSEIFLGSNAERVIRHAECPVITVKGGVNLNEMKSLALASDLTPEQDVVVKEIQQLQALLGVNIHVVRVKTPYNFLGEEEAQKQLKAFQERNQLENFTLNTSEAEFADLGILEFAEKNQCGLIAMATHGRTGLAHFFGGSTAEDVANHSRIPIWTMRVGQ